MRAIHLVATLLLMQANPAFQGSGSVSGRILSLTGGPAANVRVSVAQVPDSPAQPTGAALMSITLTDNEGRYRLENIPAGLNDGYRYRIPTEAEWEYAARAGSTGPSFAPLDTVAWHGANSLTLAPISSLNSPFTTFVPTHLGGQLQANAWGLYDMQGNVWEWTADWYSDRYYDVSPTEDPTGPPAGPLRVMKGGSALVVPTITRVSMRGNQAPINPTYIFGVRLVRDEIR